MCFGITVFFFSLVENKKKKSNLPIFSKGCFNLKGILLQDVLARMKLHNSGPKLKT